MTSNTDIRLQALPFLACRMAEFRAPPLVGDEAVMSTNDEATCSKKYAVSLGYWRDPYINLICRQSVRKTPEISRGYFARVFAVRSLVEQFIKVVYDHKLLSSTQYYY